MRFLIHMSTSEEAGSLARMLRLWTWSTCADMETELWSPGASGPAIVIWDLDAGLPPSGMVSSASTALLVCSSRTQAAIDSYSLHPDGFLQKPIQLSGAAGDSLRPSPGPPSPVRPDMGGGRPAGLPGTQLPRVYRGPGNPLHTGPAAALGAFPPLSAQLSGKSHPCTKSGWTGTAYVRRDGDPPEPEHPGERFGGLSAAVPSDGGWAGRPV